MVKIGILTFHRSYNYGAFMQCFSLSNKIAQDFPECKVEVIDYCTKRMYENYSTDFFTFVLGPRAKRNSAVQMVKNVGKCVLDPLYIGRKKRLYQGFDENIKSIPLSNDRLISDEYLEIFEMIDNKYDILVVGSDAIWEYKTYPFPNAYYPHYSFKRTKVLSYAASSDRMHGSDLDEYAKTYIKETLENMYYIGIRDLATEAFLNDVSSDLHIHHNCDPTALLNLKDLPGNLNRVEKILTENGVNLNKPIIGIMGNNDSCNMVRKMFGNKYQIVSVYQYTKAADFNFDYLTPFEWAHIFSLFSVTVTKFFHGSMLSLMNGTPTIATDYWYKVREDHITKIEDLYKRLDLMEHYFYMPSVGHNSIKLKEQLEYFINHPDTEKIMSSLKKESKYYESFRDALKELIIS